MQFKRLIGIWFVNWSFSSFLYNGMIKASFSLEWKCPLLRDLFIKLINGYISTAIKDFMIFEDIPTGPADDLGLILDNASMSSFSFIWWNGILLFRKKFFKFSYSWKFFDKVWSYILKKVIEAICYFIVVFGMNSIYIKQTLWIKVNCINKIGYFWGLDVKKYWNWPCHSHLGGTQGQQDV